MFTLLPTSQKYIIVDRQQKMAETIIPICQKEERKNSLHLPGPYLGKPGSETQ